MTKIWTVTGVIAAALTFGTSASAASNLIYCSEGSPEGFAPALYTSGTTFDASSVPLYNRLVEFKSGTTELAPGLAESWSVSEDGLSVTFNLRPGVKFHSNRDFTPTRDMNADDVIFTFQHQMDETHPFHAVGGSTFEYFSSMDMGGLIESMEKIDDLTVRFNLTRREIPFLANLGMDFASILSAEYADHLLAQDNMDAINNAPIGTGPFVFVNYQQDAVVRFRANDDFWGERPAVDNLIFAITPDASVRYQKLLAGECQVMSYPNISDVDGMRASDEVNLLEQEGFNVGYLAFNTNEAPFDDPRVRQALTMAVNKDAIVDAVFQGAGEVAKNPLPPTIWGYNDDIQPWPYDPEAARALLEEVGVSDLGTSIWAMPVQRAYNPNARRMAELIQADWAAVGVEAEIVSYEWGEYLKRSGETDRSGAVLLGWTGDNGDPDNFLTGLLTCDGVGGYNRSFWCNDAFDEAVLQARTSDDNAQRVELYHRAQEIFHEDAPWITTGHSVVYLPVRNEVQGYVISPLGKHDFSHVEIVN